MRCVRVTLGKFPLKGSREAVEPGRTKHAFSHKHELSRNSPIIKGALQRGRELPEQVEA